MNARPGLNIQIANREGIANRIRRIEEIYDAAATPAERAAAARRENDATSRAFVVLAKDKTKCENNITGSNLAILGPKLLVLVPIAQASTRVIDNAKQLKSL